MSVILIFFLANINFFSGKHMSMLEEGTLTEILVTRGLLTNMKWEDSIALILPGKEPVRRRKHRN